MAESTNASNHDALQIGDLLTGAGSDPNTSVAYLHFTYDAARNATVVELSSQPDAPAATAWILLSGVNLTTLGTHDSDIVSHLLGGSSPRGDA